jgi:ABC-type phosphate transport system substrate-binding protein
MMRLTTIAMVLALLGGVAGCGNGNGSSGSGSTPSESAHEEGERRGELPLNEASTCSEFETDQLAAQNAYAEKYRGAYPQQGTNEEGKPKEAEVVHKIKVQCEIKASTGEGSNHIGEVE